MIRSPAGFDNETRVKRYQDYYQAGYGVNLVTPYPAWTPLNLFSNGETGGWWDFTDLSTLSQDSAGTTPVTTAGQSIGLALDKSQGLALGAEIVTNGDFSNGTTGWTGTSSATLTNPSGALVVTYNAVANPGAQGSGAIVVGSWYLVSFTVTALTGGTIVCYVGSSNAGGALSTTTPGTKTAYVQATTTISVQIIGFGNTGSFTLDNVSVKRVAGNPASQPTALLCPVLGQDALGKYYAQFNGSSTFLEVLYSQTAYPATLVAAMNNTITSGNGVGIISLSQADVQYKVIVELAASGTGVTDRNSTSFSTSTVTQTGNKVVFADFSAAAVSMTVNNLTTVSTANSNAFGATTKIFLGKSRPAGLFSNARLYGALAINRSLTPTERSYLRVYLGSTMGVAL